MSPRHNSEIKIAVIEDQADLREALVAALTGAGYTAVAYAESESALIDLPILQPDVLLLDLFTSSIHGIHFLERVRNNPDLAAMKVIILTNIENEQHRKKAELLEAAAYLIKANTPITRVLEEVKTVLETE